MVWETLVTHTLAVWRRTDKQPYWSRVSTDYWTGLLLSCHQTCPSDSVFPDSWQDVWKKRVCFFDLASLTSSDPCGSTWMSERRLCQSSCLAFSRMNPETEIISSIHISYVSCNWWAYTPKPGVIYLKKPLDTVLHSSVSPDLCQVPPRKGFTLIKIKCFQQLYNK